MDKKLHVKDLISIGMFTAIYVVIYIVLSSILFTPFLFFLMVPIGALICGPVFMLYVARTGKPGCIAILGTINAVVAGLLVFGNVMIAAINLGFALLAELLAFFGKYRDFKWLTASFASLSLWVIGQTAAFWFAPQYMRDLTMTGGYSAEYADGLLNLVTPINLLFLFAGTVVAAVVSSLFAQRMLTKHFRRAGIA